MHSRGGSSYSPPRLRVHQVPALWSIQTPDVIHTDQVLAFLNELFYGCLRFLRHSLLERMNGLVERANQKVMRLLRAMLFDARVHDKWSYEQLPMVQRIMNTVEKTSTGVTPVELILNNSIRLSN